MDAVKGLMSFITASPTAYHAVESCAAALRASGFVQLQEGERWHISPGGDYFFTRNQSSLVAFRIPWSGYTHFQIIAAHSDSPCFKLKPVAGREAQGYALMNVEKYGGAIMSTWMDRPLSIAGRVIVETSEGYEARLVNIDKDLALIPNLPIHFNRSVNDGMKLNPQIDLAPVYGAAGADYLDLAAEAAGTNRGSIVGSDLYLVNRDAPRLWGAAQEFITAPRLDDLECTYTALLSMIEARPARHVNVLCIFDNEEVGSSSRQGADSTLMSDALRRLCASLGEDGTEAAIARSFMLSTDNAHAVHPTHTELYDEQNRVYMNSGVVVKSAATQKYATDGASQAVFEAICRRAGVPVQRFANRSDITGGSTLGNIVTAHASMSTVDIGLAQLAMHSANESAGARDVGWMVKAMRAFYQAEIDASQDGLIRLNYPVKK